MQKRRLGRTDLHVSAICLGTMTWGQQNTEAEGHAQMDLAFERGVNFMDTAELYPIPPKAETQGRTETYIGNGELNEWTLMANVLYDIHLAKRWSLSLGAGAGFNMRDLGFLEIRFDPV